MAGAARLAEFDDLAQAAAAVAETEDGSGMENARTLYDFGYACIERGVHHLAIRPLARALELAPDATQVLGELVVALEHEGRHARAVAVLEEHESGRAGSSAPRSPRRSACRRRTSTLASLPRTVSSSHTT